MKEYKQAIIVGAAPMEAEANRLLGILKWAGLVPPTEQEKKLMELSDCGGSCKSCPSACARKEIVKDIYLVAADGGILFLVQHGITPDFFVGDMDSLLGISEEMKSKVETVINAIESSKVPVEKDDTDTALAVKKAYEMGYKQMLLFGCSGGTRVSHTFANVQLMCQYEKLGCHIKMMASTYQAEIMMNSSQSYSKALKGSVSVICLSDVAKNVRIKGLKYEYDGDLTNEIALGVSNSFVGQDASIEVEQGTLLLIYENEDKK